MFRVLVSWLGFQAKGLRLAKALEPGPVASWPGLGGHHLQALCKPKVNHTICLRSSRILLQYPSTRIQVKQSQNSLRNGVLNVGPTGTHSKVRGVISPQPPQCTLRYEVSTTQTPDLASLEEKGKGKSKGYKDRAEQQCRSLTV